MNFELTSTGSYAEHPVPATVDKTFFRTLRAIDLTQTELPAFVSRIEGLSEPTPSYRSVNFRWNTGNTIRITLSTPLFGKLSIDVVARTRKGVVNQISVHLGNETQTIEPNTGRLPLHRLSFDCLSPVTDIEFEFLGKPQTFSLSYISIQEVNDVPPHHAAERKTPNRVGRKKRWTERITLPLAEGTLTRIDRLLAGEEVRLDLIRDSIEREIKRRERATERAAAHRRASKAKSKRSKPRRRP